MIDCPKCGFHQPKDQYCANCGIDMENYKPKPQPILKRAANNTPLHIILLFIIVLITTIFLSRQFKSFYSAGRGHKDVETVVIEKKGDLSQGEAAPEPQLQNATAPIPPPPILNAVPAEAASGATTAKKMHLKVEYSEIDRPELMKFTDNKYKPELGAYSVRDFTKGLAELKSVKILAEVEREHDAEATTSSFDFISNPNMPEVGLINHQIAIGEWNDRVLRAEIAVAKSNFNAKNLTAHTNLNLNFDLHGTEGYLICGLLPHKIAFEPGEELLQDSLLQAYSSEKFITNRSDVCLLIFQAL